MPLLTGSSSDQLNKGRHYTFTPFARASQFAQAQLQMSKLVSDKPKVAVIFENTAFGTSTSNGLREQAPGEGVEIVLFEPYSAGFTDASPLINKVKASGANALFSVSYLNDLILIVRTVKQVGLNIAINGGSGGFVIPDFYKNVGKLAEGLLGVAHWNHDIDDNAQKVNAEYKKQYRRVPVRICRRPRGADLHDRRRARAGGVDRSAKGARRDRRARRLERVTRRCVRRQSEVRPRRQEHLCPSGRGAVAERRSRERLPEGRRARAADEDLERRREPMLETVAQAVINGLLIGGIYALVSIGVTLIFGVVKIVNFAQGEFVMIGMYISFFLATQFGIDPILSLVVSMPVLFVIGVLIQHFLIRRVLGLNDMPQIFLTFALSLLIINLSLMLFTANYRTVHTWYSDEALHLGGLYVPVAKLIAFVARDGAQRGALGLPAHDRSRQGHARRGAKPRCRDADGHQSQSRVLRRARHRAGARGRRGLAADAVLSGLSDGRAGFRADGFRRRGARARSAMSSAR